MSSIDDLNQALKEKINTLYQVETYHLKSHKLGHPLSLQYNIQQDIETEFKLEKNCTYRASV